MGLPAHRRRSPRRRVRADGRGRAPRAGPPDPAAPGPRPARQPDLHRGGAARALRDPARLLPLRRPRRASRGGHAHRAARAAHHRRRPAASRSSSTTAARRERFYLNRSYYGLYMPPWSGGEIDELLVRARSASCSPPSTTTRPTTTATTTSSSRAARRGSDRSRSSTSTPPYRGAAGRPDAAVARVMAAAGTCWAPRWRRFERGVRRLRRRRATASASATASTRCTSSLRGDGRRPGRRGDRPVEHLHRHLARRRPTPARGPCRSSPTRRTLNLDPGARRGGRHAAHARRSCRCTSTASRPTWTPIGAIAARHGLRVLEDAAQAHGARCAGARAGALGARGRLQLLPRQEPRRARRRRRGHHRRRRPRRAAAAPAQLRLRARSTTTRRGLQQPPGRDPGRRAARSKLARLDAWNARRARRRRALRRGAGGRCRPRAARPIPAGAEPRLAPLRRPRTARATRCSEHLAAARRRRRSIHYPSRRTCSRRTRARRRRGRCRSPSGWPARC